MRQNSLLPIILRKIKYFFSIKKFKYANLLCGVLCKSILELPHSFTISKLNIKNYYQKKQQENICSAFQQQFIFLFLIC